MAFPSFALSRVFTRSGLPQPQAETLTDQLEESIDEKIEESHTNLATQDDVHKLELAIAALHLTIADFALQGAEREGAFHRALWVAVGIVLTALAICTAIIIALLIRYVG